MAVPEQTPYIEHTGNGVTTNFALKFQCESKDHLIVLVDEIEPPIATWSLIGGDVVFTTAPAAGKKITVQRNTPFGRNADYQSFNNSFRPQTVNGDFDRIWWKLQELGIADWILGARIDALKNYVDRKDDELKAYLMEEIRKQGVALDQLDEYYNYLMERLAQIAVDKGWDASFVADSSGMNQQQINDLTTRNVEFYSDLQNIKGKYRQRVFAQDIEKFYTYYPDTNQMPNGVTVIGKWVMDTQDYYFASWFAKAELYEDQKGNLEIGYAYATLKKRPFIIDANFWVSCTAVSTVGLGALSNSTLIFIKGVGALKLIPTSSSNYQLLNVYGVSNCKIFDPKLIGDRRTHSGTLGEWGHGLVVWDCEDVYIHRPVTIDCWGDGIDLGRRATTAASSEPTRVTIFEPYIERCRRNGISPRSSDTCRIIRPTIRYIGDSDGIAGTWPKAGIDIEPNDATGTNDKPYHKDLIIDSPTVENCFAALYAPNHFGNKIEVRITGTARFHASNTVVMGFWNRHVASEGFVDIERVVVSGPVYTGIQCALVAASKFYVRVGEIVLDKSIAGNFTVNGSYNGFAGTEGELGNADFTFTIPDNVNVLRTVQASDKPYTIGMKLRATPNSTNKPSIYTEISNANDFPKLGKHFYVDGISTRADSSASFSRRYGSVIKLKTDSDTGIRSIATNDDFSEKTVIYDPLSAVTTYGIRVNNLVLTIGGVAKTSASTTDLGAKLTFRNVPGGQTQIIEMSGKWTFA